MQEVLECGNKRFCSYMLIVFADVYLVWGGADQMIRGEVWVFLKKNCPAKSDKKSFVQQTLKSKKFAHKTGRKMGSYEGGKICVFLCLRGKKQFVSG